VSPCCPRCGGSGLYPYPSRFGPLCFACQGSGRLRARPVRRRPAAGRRVGPRPAPPRLFSAFLRSYLAHAAPYALALAGALALQALAAAR